MFPDVTEKLHVAQTTHTQTHAHTHTHVQRPYCHHMEAFYFWNSSQNTSFFKPRSFGVVYPVHTPTAPGQPLSLPPPPPPPALMSVSLLALLGKLSAPCCCWNMKLIIVAEAAQWSCIESSSCWLSHGDRRPSVAPRLIPHISVSRAV